jgi:hypothetical protein
VPPRTLLEVNRFQANNTHVQINVFSIKRDVNNKFIIYPVLMRTGCNDNLNSTVYNLLFLDGIFCYIVNISRLLRSQITKHKARLSRTQEERYVENKDSLKTRLFFKRGTISFTNVIAKYVLPAVIYIDSSQHNMTVRFIENVKPAEKIEILGGNLSNIYLQLRFYYFSSLKRFLFEQNVKINNEVDHAAAADVSWCHICERPSSLSADQNMVKDHCHYTGKFRGFAHNTCNLLFNTPNFIPCVVWDRKAMADIIVGLSKTPGKVYILNKSPNTSSISGGELISVSKTLEKAKNGSKDVKLRFILLPNFFDVAGKDFTVDRFEYIRNILYDEFGLDLCHYFSFASYAYQTMLKTTKICLTPVQNMKQYSFLQRCIRGGINCFTKRYASANNRFTDESGPHGENFIFNWDCNSLYPEIMRRYMIPVGELRFLQPAELSTFNFMDVPENSEIGYIIECDLEYFPETHPFFDSLPLCSEKDSDGCLIMSLKPHSRYVVHYMNLQQMFRLGMKVGMIFNVLEFKQSRWLVPFVDKGLRLRKKYYTTDPSLSQICKNLVNMSFGKTIERVENFQECVVVSNENTLQKYLNHSRFVDRKVFFGGENKNGFDFLIGITLKKKSVVVQKPIYVGASILDLAKYFMFEFYYSTLRPTFGNSKLDLLYYDTDSFVVNIKADWEQICYLLKKLNLEHFDFSNLNGSVRQLYSALNSCEAGYFRDVHAGAIVKEFCCNTLKNYSFRLVGDEIGKSAFCGIKRTSSSPVKVSFDKLKSTIVSHPSTGAEKCKTYFKYRHIAADNISTFAHGNQQIASKVGSSVFVSS